MFKQFLFCNDLFNFFETVFQNVQTVHVLLRSLLLISFYFKSLATAKVIKTLYGKNLNKLKKIIHWTRCLCSTETSLYLASCESMKLERIEIYGVDSLLSLDVGWNEQTATVDKNLQVCILLFSLLIFFRSDEHTGRMSRRAHRDPNFDAMSPKSPSP